MPKDLTHFHIVVIALLCLISPIVFCSEGDRSLAFQNCIKKLHKDHCQKHHLLNENITSVYDLKQPFYMRLLGWDCMSEIQYECMWITVDLFDKIYKRPVPQFYGKWPFVRLMGVQEPASVFASVLNLLANYHMLKKMMRIQRAERSLLKLVYKLFAWVCINTWVWSAVFHTRDTNFTEKMDYFSAFLLTLMQLNVFFVRYLWPKRTLNARVVLFILILFSINLFIRHIHYLGFVHFDYGYNMQMNIQVGLVNSVCWLLWSAHKYFKEKRAYVWRCAFSVVLFDLLMIFELFDFQPLLWAFDAHALWHFSTIIIPFYWYQFLIDDLFSLEELEKYE
jgi:hypothetical protein